MTGDMTATPGCAHVQRGADDPPGARIAVDAAWVDGVGRTGQSRWAAAVVVAGMWCRHRAAGTARRLAIAANAVARRATRGIASHAAGAGGAGRPAPARVGETHPDIAAA